MLFTNVQHQNYAGFFGFVLTIAPAVSDSGSHLQVHAPAKMEAITQIYDYFMYNARNVNLTYRYIDQPGQAINGDEQQEGSLTKSDGVQRILDDEIGRAHV